MDDSRHVRHEQRAELRATAASLCAEAKMLQGRCREERALARSLVERARLARQECLRDRSGLRALHKCSSRSPSAGTILVVDDDPSVLEVGALLLSHAGHNVVTAESGSQAIELIAHVDSLSLVIFGMARYVREPVGAKVLLQIAATHCA